jgi:cation diffusion facilitator family transporter
MAGESKATVIGAVAANFLIAVAKFAAAGAGRSAALLAEGIHSAIDGANDSLLLVGLRRSRREADRQHPFGYGKELYFWALIVGVSLLAAGGGVTMYEGIRRMLHPGTIHNPLWSYVALGCGFLFDGSSLLYAFWQFRKQNRGKGFWEAIWESKDPTTFMTMGEDAAAILGVAIATAGVYLNVAGWRLADGLASLLVGITLAVTAIFVIWQMRDLVIGEAVDDEIARAIHNLAAKDEAIA